MTMPLEETFVSVDVDLDTSDDDAEHFSHKNCPQDVLRPGPIVSMCGAWYVAPANGVRWHLLKEGCPECALAWELNACAFCGH